MRGLRFLVSLVEAIVPVGEVKLPEAERGRLLSKVAEFVLGQINELPGLLWLMVNCGLLGFRLVVRLRHIRGFSHLTLARRMRIVNSWAYGPLRLTRQLFRPIRCFALLAYYEDSAVRAALDTSPEPDEWSSPFEGHDGC